MQVIHTESIDLEQVADLCAIGLKRKPPTPRDLSKFHVTNLLESAKLITKGQTRYHEYEGHPVGIMSWGRIWESAVDCYLNHYATQHGGFYIPDIEQECDGIIASLDGLIMLPDLSSGLMVAETKLRFSMNTEIPLRHLQQVRAYCHLAQTVLVAYVSCHLSSTPPSAEATIQIVRLEQESIKETWDGLVQTKEYLINCGCLPHQK
jgi:hypothetical protein